MARLAHQAQLEGQDAGVGRQQEDQTDRLPAQPPEGQGGIGMAQRRFGGQEQRRVDAKLDHAEQGHAHRGVDRQQAHRHGDQRQAGAHDAARVSNEPVQAGDVHRLFDHPGSRRRY
jgi:hypothetical protein